MGCTTLPIFFWGIPLLEVEAAAMWLEGKAFINFANRCLIKLGNYTLLLFPLQKICDIEKILVLDLDGKLITDLGKFDDLEGIFASFYDSQSSNVGKDNLCLYAN